MAPFFGYLEVVSKYRFNSLCDAGEVMLLPILSAFNFIVGYTPYAGIVVNGTGSRPDRAL